MAILTKARRVKLIKSGGEYPGFMNFSGNFKGIENQGLMTFEGTIVIAKHPDNYDDIDIRKNPTGWCFGSVIDLQVQDDTGAYTHPKCLPKLFIKSGFYSPIDLRLQLEVGCVLSLYESYNTDYWRNPEEESIEETDNVEEPGVYWWQQWQKKGKKVSISAVFGVIASKLRLTTSGTLTGQLQQPWTLSGSLVQAMGNLAYKSDVPSFIWSDHLGLVKISQANLAKSTTYTYSVTDLVDYSPINSNPTVVSQLIFSAKVQEKKDNDSDVVETDEDGNPKVCKFSSTDGPLGVVNNTNDETLVRYSEEETCDKILAGRKITTINRSELKCLIFPDTRVGRSVLIPSYRKTHTQFFDDASNNRLNIEEIIEEECWGKVYREWYDSHANWLVTGVIGPVTPGVPAYPDVAIYHEELTISTKEIKRYFYDTSGKVERIESTVYQPESTILTNVVYAAGLLYTQLIPSSIITETWVRWGDNEVQEKLERRPMQLKYSEILDKREEYLATVETPTYITVTTYTRNPDGSATPGTEEVAVNLVSRGERLALVSDRPEGESSREGNTQAGATEYLPNTAEEGVTEDYQEKPIFTRRSWDSPCSNPVVPSREVIDLGLVPNRTNLELMADLLFALRQGQAYSYEGQIALSQPWIVNTFDPLPRIDITEEDGTTFVYLGHGITIDISDRENIINIDLLWLGTL